MKTEPFCGVRLWTGRWRSLALAFVGLLVACAMGSLSFAASKPNILLIIADDIGIDSASVYNAGTAGAVLPPTPNIASLATNGVVFRNAYANPLCSPTRACLLTGRFGFRTGIGDVVMGAQAPLSATEFTLPRAFSTNGGLGYQLAHFGKWHLASGNTNPLIVGGWTNYVGNLGAMVASYTNWQKTSNGVNTTSTKYATTDLVDDATKWIMARGTNPWFLWAAFNAPHIPYHLPPTNLCPQYADLSGTTNDIATNQTAYFGAMMQALDMEIGRLLSFVDRSNTHIIFLGDNGTDSTVIQPPFKFTPARDKGTLYEGGTHVPLIMSGPAVVNPGRTNFTPAKMVDIYATILEMAGSSVGALAPPGVVIDGQSLMPALQTTNTYARLAYSEIFGSTVVPQSATGRALRNAEFKLIRFNGGSNVFFDLANDPYEKTNLFGTTLSARAQSNFNSLTINFGYFQTNFAVPTISGLVGTNNTFDLTVQRDASVNYSLWRAPVLNELAWAPVTSAVVVTNGSSTVTLTDPGASAGSFFYRAMGVGP